MGQRGVESWPRLECRSCAAAPLTHTPGTCLPAWQLHGSGHRRYRVQANRPHLDAADVELVQRALHLLHRRHEVGRLADHLDQLRGRKQARWNDGMVSALASHGGGTLQVGATANKVVPQAGGTRAVQAARSTPTQAHQGVPEQPRRPAKPRNKHTTQESPPGSRSGATQCCRQPWRHPAGCRVRRGSGTR